MTQDHKVLGARDAASTFYRVDKFNWLGVLR